MPGGKLAYTPVDEPFGIDGTQSMPVPTSSQQPGPAGADQNDCGCIELAPEESTPLPGSAPEPAPATSAIPSAPVASTRAQPGRRVSLPIAVVVGSIVLMLLMVLLVFLSFVAAARRPRF